MKNNKVWVVLLEEQDNPSVLIGVFSSKEKAQKEAEQQGKKIKSSFNTIEVIESTLQ